MKAYVWMFVLAGVAVALLAAGDGKPPVSTFTDKRDKKVYKIVKIGGQYWFAENLNYDTAGSVCYDNKAENCAKYGRLYNWPTANQVCPVGFHLSTEDELKALVDYAGGEKVAGKKLKTDNYGFSALPSGYGKAGGKFDGIGFTGSWWSVTEKYARNVPWDEPWALGMGFHSESVFWFNGTKAGWFSVRCVQDDEKEKRK